MEGQALFRGECVMQDLDRPLVLSKFTAAIPRR